MIEFGIVVLYIPHLSGKIFNYKNKVRDKFNRFPSEDFL